jgi:hypothetical protein
MSRTLVLSVLFVQLAMSLSCAGRDRPSSPAPVVRPPGGAAPDVVAWRECARKLGVEPRHDSITEVPAPFLKQGAILRAVSQTPSGAEMSYIGCAPAFAVQLSDEATFAALLAAGGLDVATRETCGALVRALVLGPHAATPLESIDELFAACSTLDATDEWRRRMTSAYGRAIRPIDACAVPGAVTIHAIRSRDLLRLEVTLTSSGATAIETVLEDRLPVPQRL